MRKKKNRYGCPNPDCPSFKHQKKYKADVEVCPECGSELAHVCRAKGCYTVVEDPSDAYCLACKAKRADKKDKRKKAAAGVGGGVAAVGIPAAVKHREAIKEAVKTVAGLIRK